MFYICICLYVHIYTHVCTYTYAYMYICMYVCMYVCIYIYTYIFLPFLAWACRPVYFSSESEMEEHSLTGGGWPLPVAGRPPCGFGFCFQKSWALTWEFLKTGTPQNRPLYTMILIVRTSKQGPSFLETPEWTRVLGDQSGTPSLQKLPRGT